MGARSQGHAARVLGRYVLHGELAAGGMATVHLGRLRGEAGFARTVAIKRLHPQFAKDPDFVNMFVDEARLAARIRHPNVVPTLDVISEDGEIFLVMEYVAGESLSRLLRTLQVKKQLVPTHIATTLLAGVLHGLHAAHEARSEKGQPLEIVHRDVSPQNVLVGIDGIAHVLDFGVAKATGRLQTTGDGQIKGKLAYMAPEQLERSALTRQSDVYAAAVVLWETLTLRRLFEADSEGALLMKVLEGKIVAPSTIVPGLSKGIDEVVLRGLARDPAMRWASARDFALALEKCRPMAPPSEIGEWVQSVAGAELARRTTKVSDMEQGSSKMPAAVEPEVAQSGVRVGDVISQVSAISMSEKAAPLLESPRRGRTFFLAGGLTGLLVVGVLVAFTRAGLGHTKTAGAAAITGVPPTTASAGANSDFPHTDPLPPATGVAAAPPPPQVMNAPPISPPPDTKPLDAHPAGWAPQPRSSPPQPLASKPVPKARADCDPPFTHDAQGHKHYKLQCL